VDFADDATMRISYEAIYLVLFVQGRGALRRLPAHRARVDRAVPGHWEGDLILGLGSSAIGTLVERTTRFALMLYLPRMTGHARSQRRRDTPLDRSPAEEHN
jgi:IS30 family transposase